MMTRKFLAFLCVLCTLCGETARASLVFGAATSNRVTVTVASGIGSTAFTVMVWAKPTTQTANRRLWSLNGSGTQRAQATWQNADVNDFEFFIDRATTDAILGTNISFSNNKNYFFAFTYDESDGPRVFYRDLDTANSTVTEATYASRTVGTGATQTVVDDVIIGNRHAASFNAAWQGTISTFVWHNARLTQAELNVWAERPQPLAGTTKLFLELGWAGTGTQPDLSGNGNNGTVTGATVSNHVAKARYP